MDLVNVLNSRFNLEKDSSFNWDLADLFVRSCDPNFFEVIAETSSVDLKKVLALDPRCPADILRLMMEQSGLQNASLANAIYCNPNCPVDILIECVMDDKSGRARLLKAVESGGLPRECLQEVYEKLNITGGDWITWEGSVVAAFLNIPDCPGGIIEDILDKYAIILARNIHYTHKITSQPNLSVQSMLYLLKEGERPEKIRMCEAFNFEAALELAERAEGPARKYFQKIAAEINNVFDTNIICDLCEEFPEIDPNIIFDIASQHKDVPFDDMKVIIEAL